MSAPEGFLDALIEISGDRAKLYHGMVKSGTHFAPRFAETRRQSSAVTRLLAME